MEDQEKKSSSKNPSYEKEKEGQKISSIQQDELSL